MNWIIIILPFAFLWYRVFDSVHLEWSSNAQYSYGWIVPVLSLGLIVRNWTLRPKAAPSVAIATAEPISKPAIALLSIAMLTFLPARLIAGATPEWRPLQWVLALIATGATLVIVRSAWSCEGLKLMAFPICFFLVAVPWPTPIEQPIIQHLTSANAAFVVEVMGILGVPAIQHGNVIEVGTGVVGIDEACSGIRSFQSSIMISLFLGEYYRLNWLRRGGLFVASILLSFLFNICRTSFLTWIAAKNGVGAISHYHDSAGLVILVACTLSLWFLGMYLGRAAAVPESKSPSPAQPSPAASKPVHPVDPLSSIDTKRLLPIAIALIVWLALVEIGANLWFSTREAKLVPGPDWTIAFPEKDPTFQSITPTDKTYGLLRYDEGKEGEWADSSGVRWHAFYFNWVPGRVAGYLAKRHTPEVCMTAIGGNLQHGPDLFVTNIHNITLPIRQYVYVSQGTRMNVFHCRWEAGAGQNAFVQYESSRLNLIRGVWAGRGKNGQKVIEFTTTGYDTPEQARAAFVRLLDSLVQVAPAKTVAQK